MIFLDHLQGFADDGNAALVVAAEHGTAVGAQDISIANRFDAFTRHYGIHVRREEKRRGVRHVSRKVRDQVADVAADLFAGVVDKNRRAELYHLALKTQGDVALPAG